MAQGTIRIRCRICRKLKMAENDCTKHVERVYQVLFREPGGRQRGKTFPPGTPKKEIDRWLLERLSRIHDGTYQSPKKTVFREYAQKWLENKKSSVSYKSYNIYERIVRLYIQPVLGDLRMFGICPDDIRQVLNRAQARAIEPTYTNHINLITRMIFNDAIVDKVCADNPCKKINFIKTGLRKMQILTPDQAERLLDVSSEENRARYMLCIFAGLRLNETSALQMKDIDFDTQQINITKSFHYAYGSMRRGGKLWHLTTPKTPAGVRSIPMSRELRKTLEIRLMSGSSDPDHYVLSGANDPMTHAGVERRLYSDLKRASCPRVRFHDLRHTFASFCINRNIPLTEIQHMMGHTTIKTTSDTYGHLLPKSKGYLNVLDEMVFGRVNTLSTKRTQNTADRPNAEHIIASSNET